MRGKNQLAFLCTLILLFTALCVNAQLKTVIEDFEGYGDGQTDMKEEGIFSYGGVDLMALQHITKGYGYSGQRALEVKWQGKQWFGGWGVGIGMYKELSVATDYFTSLLSMGNYLA